MRTSVSILVFHSDDNVKVWTIVNKLVLVWSPYNVRSCQGMDNIYHLWLTTSVLHPGDTSYGTLDGNDKICLNFDYTKWFSVYIMVGEIRPICVERTFVIKAYIWYFLFRMTCLVPYNHIAFIADDIDIDEVRWNFGAKNWHICYSLCMVEIRPIYAKYDFEALIFDVICFVISY